MSFHNSGPRFLNAPNGQAAQYNNNAAGTQYNYNYYGSSPSGSDQERERLKREKQECLRSLSFTDIDTRRHNIDQVHPNTGDWVFETTEFLQWRDRTMLSGHNGVLWIKGHPGTGKSTLMKHIWKHFQGTGRTIATYFFNARGFSLFEKTALGMIRSLVCQLLVEEESTYQHFLPLFWRKKQMHNEWEWREAELKDFFLSEMQIYQGKPLVLLVDALDECSDLQVQNVVDFLEDLSITYIRREVNVSICLSSRHYPHISMGIFQELVVEKKAGHNTDIAKYVHDKLAMAGSRITRIVKEVLNKASGIFMWVVLVVAMLKKAYANGKVEAMEQKLREVPSDLDELFSTILGKENPDKHETILMLQWVLFAVRPLRPEELYYATLAGTVVTNLGPWDQSQLTADDIQRRITYSSKGLIEVLKAKGTIQFIHESVKDFLLRNQRLQSLDPALESNPIGQSHDRLKNCCVSFIGSHASVLDDISMDGSSMDDIRLKYPFLKYASSHWLDHAEAAQARNVSQVEFLRGILRGIKEDHGVERLLRLHTRFCSYEFTLRRSEKDDLNEDDLLLMSLGHKHNSVARILLEHGADISPQGWDYDVALHAAACYGSEEMVKLLITYDADPNHCYLWGTPLHDAISYGNEETVIALLEHGADVNALDAGSETALCQVLNSELLHNNDEVKRVLKLLLEHGADVNASNELHHATCNGNTEIVRFLLEHGADVNVRGGKYGTALQAAAASIKGGRELTSITKMLLDKGADVNAQGGEYGTALQAASFYGNNKIANLLLKRGADVNAQGGEYGTALQAAVASTYYLGSRVRTDIIKMLLDNGADVDARGGKYGTALQAAAASQYYDNGDRGTHLRNIAKMLLDYGADVNAQGGEYGTALQAAISQGREDMEMLLRQHGATL